MDPQIEKKIREVYILDHASCVAELLMIKRPKIDFTADYLDQLSIERLRHILVAAYLQAAKSHF